MSEEVIMIECSSCEAPLVEIWTTDKLPEKKTKLRVECGHCKDYSFSKDIFGEFYVGGTDYTVIESHESSQEKYENNKIIEQNLLLKTSRIKKYV